LRRRDRGWLFVLFGAVCLLYVPFLGSPFFLDDLSFFLSGAADRYAHSIFGFDLRWLPHASLGWTAVLSGTAAPQFFRLGNLVLHAANVMLVFQLLRQTAAAVQQDRNASSIVWGAGFGALIFALHPVAVYAAGYVVERSILMATFFALLMLLAYLRGLLTGQTRWLALAALAYFLAVFSKEHSVMMPAVLAALTVLLHPQIKSEKRALRATWTAFFAIGILIVLRAKGVFGTPYEPMAAALFQQEGIAESTPVLHLLSVLTQAGLFFKYLLLWLIPDPVWMSVDMRELLVPSLGAWQGWLGAAGFVLYGVVGVRLLLRGGRAGLAGFALLYPWLQFMLEFSTIRVQEPFVLYRSYLWMPGVLLFIPLLLAKWPGKGTKFALGAAVILLGALAANRLWVFADDYRLWNDAARLLPDERVAGASRIFYNRGQAEAKAERWDEAAADFQRVAAQSPQLAPVRYALGTAYLHQERFQDAVAQFDAGIAINPNDGRLYFGKGQALLRLHAHAQARQQIIKACDLGVAGACMVAGWMQGQQ